jgi:HK97 family phage major capsid protein
MNLQETTSKRNKLMVDANALITKAEVTTEDRSNFDRMIADADGMSADITRMNAVEDFNSEQRSTQRPPRAGFGNEDHSEENATNQKRAFKEWFRTGQISSENRAFLRTEEQRDLGQGAISAPITGGNVLVPTGFDPILHAALKNYGQIVDAVGQLSTSSGGPINVATDNDTAQGLTLVGEAVAAVETDPTVAGFTSNTDTATSGVVKISNQLLQDSEFDLEAWISQKFSTRYYRGLSQWIAQGNSSNMAALGSTLGVTTINPTYIMYGELVSLFGSLDAAYVANASFVMTSTTRASLMGLISTTGQPILQTDVAGNPFSALFGRPIVISEYSPAIAATNKPILFGDLKSAYTLRQAGGFAIKRLDQLFALTNETGYVMFSRVGGYNIATGGVPVRSLTMHA